MKTQEDAQQQHPHVQENEHNQRLPGEEEEEPQLQEVDEQRNHSISNSPPLTMHYSWSSPPPKPPPTLSSSRFDSPPDSTCSLDHSSMSHCYALSPPQIKQSKYKSPPEDQISHSYVFSSSPDVKSAKPPSPPPPAAAAAAAVHVSKVGSDAQDDEVVKSAEDGITGGGGSSRRRANLSISGRKREIVKRKTLLGFRFFGLVFCLASFSIMAADKNEGWALDSFYRYKEFRYCMSVNVMGFVYSGLQAYDLAYSLATGKLVSQNQLRYYLDFSLDQLLTYLLLSSSSSATFRVEDWESNWGKDKFPAMARSSVVKFVPKFIAHLTNELNTEKNAEENLLLKRN
ncbi:hypothetical protein P3X46_032509 [Hevea brasiliensis]|uniref:CASP-like protein n=1 Tax=Hevea brasiliensis TaxID=3981 RepID=A0ABQ9KFC9_HEVBR|nr:hypothetical protein P3X46_032509 [Hevea brasiliensis]